MTDFHRALPLTALFHCRNLTTCNLGLLVTWTFQIFWGFWNRFFLVLSLYFWTTCQTTSLFIGLPLCAYCDALFSYSLVSFLIRSLHCLAVCCILICQSLREVIVVHLVYNCWLQLLLNGLPLLIRPGSAWFIQQTFYILLFYSIDCLGRCRCSSKMILLLCLLQLSLWCEDTSPWPITINSTASNHWKYLTVSP